MTTYTREDDGAEMVEVKPHQFVSRHAADRLGLVLRKPEAPVAAPTNKAMKRAPSVKRKQNERVHA